MALDYIAEANKYRPDNIKTLFVGEAPPANGKTYFYVPKIPCPEISMPATIFCHYFDKRPESIQEYRQFLNDLKNRGVFLVDITDEPIKVRDRSYPDGINPKGLEKIKRAIPHLKDNLLNKKINIPESSMIFLLARRHYAKNIKIEFPKAKRIRWKDFRESRFHLEDSISSE